ncbi:baseplate J/gp47 family protein [Providencia sp. PROV039]|uniref:baseplate J/gp47 family protein n=1 Tax=Providencia sp. PROV039 TaxID=2949770 RepID=UPI00234A26FA|nr:baseplate J/gp47 family protein [Providencia sp. PROV039]
MLNIETVGLAPVITEKGITSPDYPTILQRLQELFRQIYGNDVYLEPDSKDGQMLAIYALAIQDANNAAVTAYNSFSPSTSTGQALSNNVAINGLSRNPQSNSTVDVLITGQVGTVISNGTVKDVSGNIWSLPESVVIGTHGDVTVTAISQKAGAIIALPGEVNQIGTPTRGWQSVTNIATATPGRKVETDGDLRIRRSKSVALPSRTVLDGVIGSVSQIVGVARLAAFENDTSLTDSRGISPHSIALIVDGGDARTIAEVIALKKTPGTGTFGNIETIVTNHYGVTLPIHFSRPESVPIFVKITLEAFEGYTTLVGDKIKKAVAEYLNNLEIGTDIYRTKLFSPANLQSDPEGGTFYISKLEIGLSAGGVAEDNITLKYHQFATSNIEYVEIVTT